MMSFHHDLHSPCIYIQFIHFCVHLCYTYIYRMCCRATIDTFDGDDDEHRQKHTPYNVGLLLFIKEGKRGKKSRNKGG